MGQLAPLDREEMLDHEENKGNVERQDNKAQKVFLDQVDHLVLGAPMVREAHEENKVMKVHKDRLDPRDHRVSEDLKVSQDLTESLVLRADRDPEDKMVLMESLVRWVQLVLKGQLDV